MKFRNLLVALLAVFAIFAAACGDDDSSPAASGDESTTTAAADESPADGPVIKIGAQDFGESAILAEIYGQALTAAGYEVEQVSVGGFRDVLLPAFENGEVNLSPEYVASMLEFLNDFAGEATSDVDATATLLQAQLAEIGLVATAPSSAVDTNTFAVTQEASEANGWTKISDLPADGAGVIFGAPQSCETNAFCLPGLADVYGIDLAGDFTPLEISLIPAALVNGDIQVGVVFSTSGQVEANDLVVLEDDKGLLAADNIVPVISAELEEAYGADLVSLLDSISAALDTDTLRALVTQFEIDKEDPDAIAAAFLADADL